MVERRVVEVKVWDHSQLGGPMGTEDVSLIRTELFSAERKAIEWAIKYANAHASQHFKWYASNDIKKAKGNAKKIKDALADIGSIGFTFTDKPIS